MIAPASLGFDTPRLVFAGRTAVAVCVAVLLGWTLGLEHPQWAGMTVWAAAQPSRGQLLEKGFFRIAGTISGTIAGVVLVLASQIHPALLVAGLALWVGACTAIGNLQRGLVSYGTVLAGYTAAMVSLLDAAHPDRVFALGLDRMATVLTGVAVAMAAGALFAPSLGTGAVRRRVQDLVIDLLDWRGGRGGDPAALLSRIAATEDGLDPHGAGSLRSRREVKSVRAVLIAALGLLLRPSASADFTRAADRLRHDDIPGTLAALAPAPEAAELSAALRGWDRAEAPALPVALHRDWIGAREAGLRATGALLLFGALWLVTGFHAGPFMLLGLSVMISLFSSFENPARMMRFVFIGQIYGVLGALACRWLVWPHAGSELEMVLMMFPFILLGPLLVGHNRTVATSFDYNMVFLLMLQPHLPLSGTFGLSVQAGLAVVAAPLCAMLLYRLVYPPTLKRRIATLLGMMLNDLRRLAADPAALGHRQVWRARLYHRTLRLVRLTERSAQAEIAALPACLALLTLSQAAMAAHQTGGRAAEVVLARLAGPWAPAKTRDALDRLARRTGDPLFARAAAAVADLPPV